MYVQYCTILRCVAWLVKAWVLGSLGWSGKSDIMRRRELSSRGEGGIEYTLLLPCTGTDGGLSASKGSLK